MRGARCYCAESATKKLLGIAHSHGNLEALLNVVLGYLICRVADPTQTLAKAASALLIVGAVFHSGTVYLAGAGLAFALNFTPIGAISMVVGGATMVPLVARGMSEPETS